MKSWKIVSMDQGSPSWHAWRNDGIGASEARYLISWNNSEISNHLIKLKTTPQKPFRGNALTRQGNALEPIARSAYEARMGATFSPACIVHREQPWLRASLDGLSICQTRAVEIKCGAATMERAVAGEISSDYRLQLQYVMAITGFESVDFWCYRPDLEPVFMTIARDDKTIATLIRNAGLAWEQVIVARAA